MDNDCETRQQQEDLEVKRLEDAGHTCIKILESYPSQHIWCGKEVCNN